MQIVRMVLVWSILTLGCQAKQFLVIIDPAGDAKHAGRQLDDAWERGITMQCAQAVQKRMEMIDRSITILLTRMPGEVVTDLQNAQLANQLQATIFISLNFYQEQSLAPHWYTYLLDLGEDYILKSRDYTFYYADQAHMLCKDVTKKYAQIVYDHCKKAPLQSYNFHEPQHAPIKQLIGVACPALCFDIGLKSKESWKNLVDQLCSIIQQIYWHSDHHE